MSAIDSLVGERIKARRLSLKMTQTHLADRIGVTFQQVQKYENGTNRVSAARLWEIADVFDVPITFFFEGVENDGKKGTSGFLSDQSAIEMVDLFGKLNDPQKKAVLSFLRSVASARETQLA